MEHLTFWDATKSVPQASQKAIKGGRLSGMTDIAPMWRYYELTKHFGPCGIGWKYTIVRTWLEKGEGVIVAAFAEIALHIKVDGQWSDAIPGIGGSMFVAKESGGPHTSDECYKMAVTDALSVACKMLGMAADVYWAAGSKYTGAQGGQEEPPPPQVAFISEAQGKMLAAKMKASQVPTPAFFAHFNVARLGELGKTKVNEAIQWIEVGYHEALAKKVFEEQQGQP